jgi:hypothetical protein
MPRTILRTVLRLAIQDDNKVGRHVPGRTTNALSGREREYLTPGEVDRLVKTAAVVDATASAMGSPS